jgi:predicted GIY-YIG superfamily endonuclease
VQDEVARQKRTLSTMDEFVTKTESALTLEQALNEASKLQKENIVERMESLVSQV